MADKLLDDAARIIRREALQLVFDAFTDTDPLTGEEVWEDEDARRDHDEMMDIAALLEARSNSSDHSRGAKEAG